MGRNLGQPLLAVPKRGVMVAHIGNKGRLLALPSALYSLPDELLPSTEHGVAFRDFIHRLRYMSRRATRVLPPPVAIGDCVLREATMDDLRALAELHVRTFNETHLGPGGSGPTYATREWQWRAKLAETDATNFVLVLETEAGQLVGFIWCHPTKDNPGWAARLNKIYLLRDYQRRGLGKRMVAAAVARLLEHGLTSMVLFTEVDNEPACRFYDQLGGARQLNERGEFEGMYGWADVRRLSNDLAALTARDA